MNFEPTVDVFSQVQAFVLIRGTRDHASFFSSLDNHTEHGDTLCERFQV